MNFILDHVSVLVKSVDNSAKIFADCGMDIGNKKVFKDIGTEEVYIGKIESQALLLLQAAVSDGVYMRALKKRGTGIHHVAIATDDFAAFNEKLSDLGWFVHPASLRNYKKGKTVFYVRPGVYTIIELITAKELPAGSGFITEVMVNAELGKENCINGIGLSGLKCSNAEGAYFVINGNKWIVDSIL